MSEVRVQQQGTARMRYACSKHFIAVFVFLFVVCLVFFLSFLFFFCSIRIYSHQAEWLLQVRGYGTSALLCSALPAQYITGKQTRTPGVNTNGSHCVAPRLSAATSSRRLQHRDRVVLVWRDIDLHLLFSSLPKRMPKEQTNKKRSNCLYN